MNETEFARALLGVDTATVANAVEGLEVRDRTEGYADLRLRRVVAQPEPMVGFALTFMVNSTMPRAPEPIPRLAEFLDAVANAPKPCVVVCQESGPTPERGCHMGDVVGTRLAAAGVVGVVSGSGVRDLAGLQALGLSAFALGTVASHGSWRITDINVDVDVAGLRIRPGDLLHGDDNGLVSVPAERPGHLLRLIAQVQAKEQSSRRSTVPPSALQH